MKAKRWITTLALVALVASSTEARVRRSQLSDPHNDYTQRGIQLYAGFGGQGYRIEDHNYDYLDERESNGSFFFGMGIGLDRGVSLFLEGTGSDHETDFGNVTFGTAMLGIKYAPNSGHRYMTQPYGKVSLGGIFLDQGESPYAIRHRHDDNNGYMGPAFGIALGIDHFIGRRTAIFGEAGLTTGQFDTRIIDGHEHELADEIAVTSAHIQFGLRFRL